MLSEHARGKNRVYPKAVDEAVERARETLSASGVGAEEGKLKPIAEAVQVRVTQYPTHIHLGQWYQSVAVRKNVEAMIEAPVSVFWNVEKKGR